eukprot:5054849-Alexandrium_andersonii.AAC.1
MAPPVRAFERALQGAGLQVVYLDDRSGLCRSVPDLRRAMVFGTTLRRAPGSAPITTKPKSGAARRGPAAFWKPRRTSNPRARP